MNALRLEYPTLAATAFTGRSVRESRSAARSSLSAFRNSFVYAGVVVISGIVFGMLLALALNAVTRFIGFVRTIYFTPHLLPATAMVLLWGLLFQPAYGLLNQLLVSVNLPPSQWIYGVETATGRK